MDNEQIQFRQRSQVISSRSCRHPNPQPATNTLDSSTTNEERRKPRGSKIVSLSSSASSQGVSPRADSVTFCSCGSSLRFKSVGSGGGNCVSHHEGAASPTLELCRYEDTDGSSISTLSEERREPRGRETAALSSSAGGQGEIPTAERVRAASNSSSCPRADRADSFICPRCGSISSVTTVGSGGGDRSSHHDGAASPTLELQASSSRRGFIAPEEPKKDADIAAEEATENTSTSVPIQSSDPYPVVPIKGGRKTDRSSSSSQDAIPSADSCPVCGSISSSGSFGSGGRNSHNDSSSLQEESAAKVLDTLPTLKPPGEPHPPPRHYMCSSKDIKDVSKADARRVTSVGSGGGNRASLLDTAGSPILEQQDVLEADTDILTEEIGGNTSTSAPIQAVDSGSCSVPVPEIKSSLKAQEPFMLTKTRSHCELIIIGDMKLRMTQNELICCPQFSIDHHGYKICPRIGLGKEHISFYIAVMRGESKKWPFTMTVFLRIINQSGGEHREKMFHCHKNTYRLKECLRNPKSAEAINTAMGYPQFLPRGRLEKEGYIRNNEMHLELYFCPKETPIDHKPELPSVFR